MQKEIEEFYYRLYRLIDNESAKIPDCKACHGYHEITPYSESKNITQDYCSECHNNLLLIKPFHSIKFVFDETCMQCQKTQFKCK